MPASRTTPVRIALLVLAAALLAALLAGNPSSAAKGDAKKQSGKPRLAIGGVDSPPATAAAGTSLPVSGTIRNRGKSAYGGPKDRGTIRIELASGSVEKQQVGTAAIPRLKKGQSKPFNTTVSLPASLASGGPLVLTACVRKQGDTGALSCKSAATTIEVTPQVQPPPQPGPDFTPGSRSLGDPYFPQIGNGGYDALNYLIELDYDPADNSFAEGTSTTITMQATQNLSEFSLDFQRDLTVSAVTIDGAPAASFQQVDATPEFAPEVPAATQPAKLVVTPVSGITDGSTFEVKVSYSGVPVEITDADESFEGWVRSCRFANFTPPCDGAYTVNEPIGVQSWYPVNNYPTDKATFETVTTVPTTHVALGTGELEGRTTNGDGTWTWDWVEDDRTGAFLTTATVGLFDYSANTSLTENLTGRNIPIYKAIDSSKNPTSKATFQTNTAAIPDVMNYLADNFGPYPFDSTGAVTDIAPDVGYALENQTKPHYASGFTSNGVGFSPSTQVHELSHQWFGDAVSPATWREIWFSEGWATFIENAYDPGPPAGEDTAKLEAFFDDIYSVPDDPGNGDTDWTLPPAELGGPENLFNGFSVYDRPGAMIIGYRLIIGQSEFYEFARGIIEDYGYGTISEDQFVQEALDASGFTGADLALLDDYFQQWLHSESKPTLTPDDFGP